VGASPEEEGMSVRVTAGLVILLAALAVLVWYLEGRDVADSATDRFAQGLFCPYEADELVGFEIVYPGQSFALERREEGWWLVGPVEDRADPEDLSSMLAALESQEVTRWLPPPTLAQIEEFGLDRPRPELRLRTRQGTDTLRFGRLNEVEKRLWVQASWRDSLALVSTLLRTHFLKGRVELADKRPLAGVPREKLESVHILNDRGGFELAWTDQGWEIRTPERYRADDATITRMLERLWNDSVIDFIDLKPEQLGAFGFESPRATMTLKLASEERPRLLQVGRSMQRLSYVRHLDRGPAFLLDSLTTAPLLESFSAFLSTVLISFPPGGIVELREEPGGAGLLRAEGERWTWTDGQGRELSPRAVSVLIGRLSRLSTERVSALLPRADQLDSWGLSPPERSIELRFANERHFVVEFGSEVDGRRHFRRADYPTVYSLPAEALHLPWPRHDDAPAEGRPGGSP